MFVLDRGCEISYPKIIAIHARMPMLLLLVILFVVIMVTLPCPDDSESHKLIHYRESNQQLKMTSMMIKRLGSPTETHAIAIMNATICNSTECVYLSSNDGSEVPENRLLGR